MIVPLPMQHKVKRAGQTMIDEPVAEVLFPNHKLGRWNQFLSYAKGALSLWSRTELPQGAIVNEAIRIEARTFDAAFWKPPAE